jgi:vanillate O-demethylase monooxygenase subunit
VALRDLCPHRYLPLSQGQVKDDEIHCGYHGLAFDRTGQCTLAPDQETIPPNARVASYPVADRMGLTWVWMGDAAAADPADIFDLPQYRDPTWGVGYGDALHVEANYLLLCDNLCDPTHVVYVHPTTLGVPGEVSETVTYERTDWGVETARWTLDSEPIAFHKAFGNFTGTVDRWQFYLMHVPSVSIIDFGSAAAGAGARDGRRDDCIQVFSCHFMTPETESTTYDYWLHVRNFAAEDDSVSERISDQFRTAFAEDKVVLEAIQIEEERHGTRGRVGLDLDGSAGLFRRMIDERIRDEAA